VARPCLSQPLPLRLHLPHTLWFFATSCLPSALPFFAVPRPQELCQTCIEVLNQAGLFYLVTAGDVSGAARRRLLQSGVTYEADQNTTCLNSTANSTVLLPAAAQPLTNASIPLDDIYYCGFNVLCSRNATAGVAANDTSYNVGGNITVTGITMPPTYGSVVLRGDGSFDYTPKR
jgi:hypothetical protein